MKSTLLLASAVALVAAAYWLPGQAAQPAATSGTSGPAATPAAAASAAAPAPELITFDQYRDYRIHYIEQRRASLAARLTETGLDAEMKAKLGRQKDYYDAQAALPAAERDRRFRARFDEIDTNHDGTLDLAERAAWRQHERAYYRQLAADRAARSP